MYQLKQGDVSMKQLFLLITLVLFVLSISQAQTDKTEPPGSGTIDDPYQISTLGHLSWLTQTYTAWNKVYVQAADIDASETATWDDSDDNGDGDKYNDPNDLTMDGNNEGWLPVELFNGFYNGSEHVIDGLSIINRVTTTGYGLFKIISGGTIENLGLTNVDIRGAVLVGVLAASCKENIVNNCYTTGTVTLTTTEKSYKYGGFFANIISGISEISNCHSSVDIIGTPYSYYIGGFVGNIKGVPAGSIYNCYASGDIINGGQSCAGFVAKNEAVDFTISESYSIGDVSAVERSGGFVAYNKNGAVIENCYSFGDVKRTSGGALDLGGFCGYNKESVLKNCYSIGSVFYADTVITDKGFAGRQAGTATACFFDSTVSNQDSSSLALAKSTDEMMTEATFADSSWDMVDVWEVVNNYPNLRNNSNKLLAARKAVSAIKPSGSGTADDPFIIDSLANLSWLTQNPSGWYAKYYVQTSDIDASETVFWDYADDNEDGDLFNDPNDMNIKGNNEGWKPIGGEFDTCRYDGGRHVINGLTMVNEDHLGFFNTIKHSTIKNLGLTDIDITGTEYIGGLAATCYGDTVSNCYTTGVIESDEAHNRIGGLIGYISGSTVNVTINDSYSDVDIIGGAKYIGGFIGNIKGVLTATVENCYAAGDIINSSESAGGFAGKTESPVDTIIINKCYAVGDVESGKYVGGFVGYTKNSVAIVNSYSLGDIVQPEGATSTYLGGFCGYNNAAVIENSYSVGSIEFAIPDTVIAGNGFIAKQKGTVTACFFDSTASNQDSSSAATAKSTEDMQTDSTFIAAGWDFGTVWEIVGNNYPTFREIMTSIDNDEMSNAAPTEYVLNQNYPNPFNPTTQIGFSLPVNAHVKLTVYNILGQKVVELLNKKMTAGHHEIKFNAANLASGVYIYRISTDHFVSVKKMMLIK
jgi:hypothetical protein